MFILSTIVLKRRVISALLEMFVEEFNVILACYIGINTNAQKCSNVSIKIKKSVSKFYNI